MDLFLLHAVVGEAAARLLQHELLRVACLGHHRYLLRFATSRRDNLLISVRPDLPRVHLLGPESGRQRELAPDPFGAFLDNELGGAILETIELDRWDRVLDLRFRTPPGRGGSDQAARSERRLVVEILGRSSNLYCLNPSGGILAHARTLRSAYREPAEGVAYRKPPGRDHYDGIPAGKKALPDIRERFDDVASFLKHLSPHLARDLASGSVEDAPAVAWRRLEAMLESAAAGIWSTTVYSLRPLDDLREGDEVGQDDLLITPFSLPSLDNDARYHATSFESPSQAAATGFGLLERLRDFLADRAHHEALVRREIARLEKLLGKLHLDRDRAGESERFREWGEALLAGLSMARIDGASVIVPNPYDPEGSTLEIPIDPARSLQENADALFSRYKKGKRGIGIIGERLKAAQTRLDAWRGLSERARTASGIDELNALREEMARLGLVHAPRSPKKGKPSPRKEVPARVRRHSTREGFDILVGKSGEENDTLTFRVASPWDFWMHAAGHPGAHVIVRNPQRLKKIPDTTLRTAASIAAYYSGAKSDTKVEVHYTQRKHVHKRKGMPRGQVLIRHFQSIQVVPRLPTSGVEDL